MKSLDIEIKMVSWCPNPNQFRLFRKKIHCMQRIALNNGMHYALDFLIYIEMSWEKEKESSMIRSPLHTITAASLCEA